MELKLTVLRFSGFYRELIDANCMPVCWTSTPYKGMRFFEKNYENGSNRKNNVCVALEVQKMCCQQRNLAHL
jgi:hypothetical protein